MAWEDALSDGMNASVLASGVSTIQDILGAGANASRLYITLPVAGDVRQSTIYGEQDSRTGTLVPGGGGGLAAPIIGGSIVRKA